MSVNSIHPFPPTRNSNQLNSSRDPYTCKQFQWIFNDKEIRTTLKLKMKLEDGALQVLLMYTIKNCVWISFYFNLKYLNLLSLPYFN